MDRNYEKSRKNDRIIDKFLNLDSEPVEIAKNNIKDEFDIGNTHFERMNDGYCFTVRTKDSFYMEQLVESLKNIFGDSFCEKAENYLEAIKRYIESETQLKVHYTADVEDDYITINAEKGNWHYRRNMHFGEFNLIVRKYEAELFARGLANEMREAYVSDTFLRRKTHD